MHIASSFGVRNWLNKYFYHVLVNDYSSAPLAFLCKLAEYLLWLKPEPWEIIEKINCVIDDRKANKLQYIHRLDSKTLATL